MTVAATAARADELRRDVIDLRFDFDPLRLPAGEHLGLLGIHYRVSLPRGFSAGPAVYSAVSGERGGFFTGGLDVGWRGSLRAPWAIDAGLFVGGGGGGAAPQGGGLMLRPHGGLVYRLGDYAVNAGYSRVWFPNGDIDSDQIYVAVEHRFSGLHIPGWAFESLPSERLVGMRPAPGLSQRHLALVIKSHRPKAGTQGTRGAVADEAGGLVGFSFTQYDRDQRFWRLETLGALQGEIDGYAQILGGVGRSQRFAQDHHLEGWLALGAGGGGAVDTGGGALGAVELAWRTDWTQAVSTALRVGYLTAATGDLDAWAGGLELAYRYQGVSFSRGAAPLAPGQPLQAQHWRAHLIHQTYDAAARKGGGEEAVQLLGGRLDGMMTPHWYWTGTALGAYSGGAGGYAAGLVGVGWSNAATASGPAVGAELAIGAGGGGGVAVGGGLLLQPGLSLSIPITSHAALRLAGGWVHAPGGGLDSPSLDIGLQYRFSTLRQ